MLLVYPKVLSTSDAMYKEAKRIGSDSAIFNERKALLLKHFEEHPIYLDESYYTNREKFSQVQREDLDRLAGWRDCHYYSLREYKGHRFFIMTGGKYD